MEALIIDEASCATEPSLYIPLCKNPSKLMIVGDPKQPPATVLSDVAKRNGYDISLHQRLMFRCRHPYKMLDTQYRMHPEIMKMPNSHYYNGRIANGNNVEEPQYGVETIGHDGKAYSFIEVDGDYNSIEGSLQNEA